MRTLLLVFAAVAALALAGTSAGAVRETLYDDAAGDSGAAMDVTSVDVADNGTDIGFRVPFGLPAIFPAATDVAEILINADRNVKTGRTRDGADYALFFQGGDPASYGIAKLDGTQVTDVHFDDAEVVWGLGLEFDIDKNDFGIGTSFDFGVVTSVGLPIQSPNADHAPDTGFWHYTLAGIPPGVTFDKVLATPVGKARTGKKFTLQVAVQLSAGDQTTTRAPQALTCSATVGKAKLKTTVAAASAAAGTCTMTIPKKTKGKALTVKVTGTYGTESKTTTYTAKIAA